MTLVTPAADFASTLEAVPGLFAKLRYITELRDSAGHYDHWGLSQLHGTTVMGGVIRAAHTDVLSALLRAPVQNALEDLREAAAAERVQEEEYLEFFELAGEACVPPQSARVVPAHLQSLLLTLRTLIRSSRRRV
jgi:hypothetical protein